MGADRTFLPQGLVWIGFDETGRSIAASVENMHPIRMPGRTMEGCASVRKCKVPSDGILFGKVVADFDVVPTPAACPMPLRRR